MSKALRITVFAASVLLVVGIGLWVVGASRSGSFLPTEKAFEKAEQKEQVVEEAFDRIVIDEISADVELRAAEDGVCRIVYSQTEREPLEIYVKNGTLTLERRTKKNLGLISIGSVGGDLGTTTLYLPEAVYQTVNVQTVSGELSLKPGLSAKKLELETVSGNISVSEMSPDLLTLSSVSGDQHLVRVTAGEIRCEATSGEIVLEACDAGQLDLETISGDVTATLLTEKAVSTSTTSGEVSVPNNRAAADPCRVETVSGDIRVETP